MPAVYILTNRTNYALYIGATNCLNRRTYEHILKLVPSSFSAHYNTLKLVYYEIFDDELTAFRREHQLKNWHRQWKRNLITNANPKWHDLTDTLLP